MDTYYKYRRHRLRLNNDCQLPWKLMDHEGCRSRRIGPLATGLVEKFISKSTHHAGIDPHTWICGVLHHKGFCFRPPPSPLLHQSSAAI